MEHSVIKTFFRLQEFDIFNGVDYLPALVGEWENSRKIEGKLKKLTCGQNDKKMVRQTVKSMKMVTGAVRGKVGGTFLELDM